MAGTNGFLAIRRRFRREVSYAIAFGMITYEFGGRNCDCLFALPVNTFFAAKGAVIARSTSRPTDSVRTNAKHFVVATGRRNIVVNRVLKDRDRLSNNAIKFSKQTNGQNVIW